MFNVAMLNFSQGRDRGGRVPPRDAAHNLGESVRTEGPWVALCHDAEEFWRKGNDAAAVLLWMEMADCGIAAAAVNAGRAFLEVDRDLPCADRNARKKLATMMVKRALAFERPEAYRQMLNAYLAREMPERAGMAVLKGVRSPFASYYTAIAHINGYLPGRLVPTFGNLSKAINDDLRFVVPVLVLAPQVLSFALMRIANCTLGRCTPEEVEDVIQIVRLFFWRSFNEWALLFAVAFLIFLVRMRIAHCLKDPNNG
jgi:hypothetical protein